jgi:hypothetical protein
MRCEACVSDAAIIAGHAGCWPCQREGAGAVKYADARLDRSQRGSNMRAVLRSGICCATGLIGHEYLFRPRLQAVVYSLWAATFSEPGGRSLWASLLFGVSARCDTFGM